MLKIISPLLFAVLLGGCGNPSNLIGGLEAQLQQKDDAPGAGLLEGDQDAKAGDKNCDGKHDSDRNYQLVCHIPPGNPSEAHTLWSKGKSLQAHLGHGDKLGRCPSHGSGDADDRDEDDRPDHAH